MQLAFDFSDSVDNARLTDQRSKRSGVSASYTPKSDTKTSRSKNRSRVQKGQTSYHAGLAAEDCVANTYRHTGHRILARRFRGAFGEIDLVTRDGDELVFVEVKRARSHDVALSRVSRRQFERIYAAATEFADAEPAGQLTPMRFDVATVDHCGDVKLHPGILAHF